LGGAQFEIKMGKSLAEIEGMFNSQFTGSIFHGQTSTEFSTLEGAV
jgi:hypothetical protein